MELVDIFADDAFSVVSLTKSILALPYKPSRLGAMGLFKEEGITTATAVIESLDGTLTLLPTAPRGGPGSVAKSDKRKLRSFPVPHIPHSDAVLADAVQGVREMGSADAKQNAARVVTGRLKTMRGKHELTHEYHRIGAIQGRVLDADGSTELYNMFTLFGVSEKTIDFVLGTAGTKVRNKVLELLRHIELILGASNYDHVHVMCGSNWFDAFISHAKVTAAYDRWQQGEFLRNDPRAGFKFGGAIFEEYRGKVGNNDFIDKNEARAFPVGVPDLFVTHFAPANYMETVNTVGHEVYAKQAMMKFDKGVELETQSNPLMLCTRPATCVKLTTSG